MHKEIDALELNKTWSVKSLPEDKYMIRCKWVFIIKYNVNGSIECYEFRFVAHSNRQVEGVDYKYFFSTVATMSIVWALLKVVAVKDWELHQMDVRNAFLHDDLDEEVFMKFPQGFTAPSSNVVCRLKKILYVFKQAPRYWFEKISITLKEYEFV